MSDGTEGRATREPEGSGPTRWTAFRVALFLSGMWLMGYVAYRYTLFNPPQHGTVYGTIFPAALLLAATGLVMAVRPAILGRRGGIGPGALKLGLSGFGVLWMATGLHCTLSLLEGIGAAPLGGSVDMIHMVSDHVFLPASVAVLAWAPDAVARWLGAPSADAGPAPSAGVEAALEGAGGA